MHACFHSACIDLELFISVSFLRQRLSTQQSRASYPQYLYTVQGGRLEEVKGAVVCALCPLNKLASVPRTDRELKVEVILHVTCRFLLCLVVWTLTSAHTVFIQPIL